MTTDQMRYFLAAAQQQNFTAAAELLYVTQPALSRQIASLESELGVQLFNRSNNVVRLTEIGLDLQRRLSLMYNDYELIVRHVNDIAAGKKNHLRIGSLEDQILGTSMKNGLKKLLTNHPDIELEFIRMDHYSLFNALQKSAIDVAFTLIYDEYNSLGFSYLSLYDETAYLAVEANHELANHKAVTTADIYSSASRVPLIMVNNDVFPPPLQHAARFSFPFDLMDEELNVHFLSSSGSIPLYVAAGFGMTLVNGQHLIKNTDGVVRVPLSDGSCRMRSGFVWRSDNTSFLLRELLDNCSPCSPIMA